MVHIDGPQISAAVEHCLHVGYLGRIETAQVKACQPFAINEHATHIGHLRRVEVAYINACQLIAIIKHIFHIGDLAGVQIIHVRDRLKIDHVTKPKEGGRRAGISKRRVKEHFGHIDVPIRKVGARVQVVGRAWAGAALGVVVERQRGVRRRVAGIGFLRMDTQGAHHRRHKGEESD